MRDFFWDIITSLISWLRHFGDTAALSRFFRIQYDDGKSMRLIHTSFFTLDTILNWRKANFVPANGCIETSRVKVSGVLILEGP